MNREIKISIITVCYNAEAVIEKTIQSVLNQKYQKLEYILIDGGSNDKTLDIIKKYSKDTRVKYLSEPDEGIYDAMNKGARMATGEYVEFLNAGDVLVDENIIQAVADRITQCHADIVYGDILYEHPDGKVEKRVYGQFCASLFYYLLGDCINHQAIFAKRECFKYLFDTSYQICADREWMIRQKKMGRSFRATGITICQYSLDENSTSIKYKEKYFEEADRCVREQLKGGYPLFWMINKVRSGKISARVLHACYRKIFLRKD